MAGHHRPKNPEAPQTNVCIYRVKNGKESEFVKLLERHWPTLHKAGLATSEPANWYRTADRKQRVVFVEVFTWVNAGAPDTAHQTPAVMQVWEPMGALCEDMEFLMQFDE